MAENHWGQRARTWLAVTLITMLVWLYAEGQAITQSSEQVMVTFVAPGQNVAIEPKAPFGAEQPVRVPVTFRGSTGQLGQVRTLIERGPIEVEVLGRTADGSREQHIVVKDALLNSRLGELGVNIVETTPPMMTLHVEALTTETLPVKLADQGLQLDGQPQFEPAEVQITLPARLADELEGESVYARLDEAARSDLEPNTPATLSRVALEPPEALRSRWTTIEPGHVDVTLTIRKQTDTIVKELISVELALAPVLLQQYRFEVRQEDQNLRDIELTGPSDVLERIQAGEISVRAIVRPTIDQLDNDAVGDDPTVIELPVELELPDDVAVTSLLPEVPVTVTRR